LAVPVALPSYWCNLPPLLQARTNYIVFLQNALNQGGPVNLQLPLAVTIPSQQRQQVVGQSHVQLQGKVEVPQQIALQQQQQQISSVNNTIIRVPVASRTESFSGNQQMPASINLMR